MKVSDYKPALYEDNIEMNALLNTEEIEFENRLKLGIENSYHNTFIKTANEQGIANYEKILNITSIPENESLDFRRDRVINRLTTAIPFTEIFLRRKLTELLGEGNWEYTLDYNNYLLTIKTLVPGNAWYVELLDFFNKIVPCNIEWKLELYAVSWKAIQDNFTTWQAVLNKDMTWQEITNGAWL